MKIHVLRLLIVEGERFEVLHRDVEFSIPPVHGQTIGLKQLDPEASEGMPIVVMLNNIAGDVPIIALGQLQGDDRTPAFVRETAEHLDHLESRGCLVRRWPDEEAEAFLASL